MEPWISVNWTAVVVAAIVRIVAGAAWYAPPVFGRRWERTGGMDEGATRMPGAIGVQALGSFVMAYILAQVVGHFGVADVWSGALVGAIIWVGFVATIMLPGILFEKRSMQFFFIYAGYQLVTLAAMGAIISAF